jgi:hypothetical protein
MANNIQGQISPAQGQVPQQVPAIATQQASSVPQPGVVQTPSDQLMGEKKPFLKKIPWWGWTMIGLGILILIGGIFLIRG